MKKSSPSYVILEADHVKNKERGIFMSNTIYEKLIACKEAVRKVTDFEPDVALVLGSGLGAFADNIKVETEVSSAIFLDFLYHQFLDMQESSSLDTLEIKK
jgi:hypothetical protein